LYTERKKGKCSLPAKKAALGTTPLKDTLLIPRVIPWSPIARGILAKPVGSSSLRSETDGFLKVLFSNEMKESEKTVVNRVEEIAKKRGVSMAQVATAWVLSKEGNNFLLRINVDG
jgi:hypothetical protein